MINSDADEFWLPEHGDIAQVLGEVDPRADAVAVERTNFVPTCIASQDTFANFLTLRERLSVNALGAPLPSKVCHRATADIVVSQGNHDIYLAGRALAKVSAPITILHFPMRTYAQFANKISKGGAAYARNSELSPETGLTWRRLYEVWKRGELEEYYQASIPDAKAVEKGICEGTLVFDDRLKKALARVMEQGLRPVRQ